MEEDTT
jgi:hypothetical protein